MSFKGVVQVLVLCPNPTIDRQVFVPEYVSGSVMRATANRTLPGGKAIDVVRAMAAHQVYPSVLVALPESGGGYEQMLATEGIEAEFFGYPGTVRETIITYEDSGRATVINGRGAPLGQRDWLSLCDRVAELSCPGQWTVSAGSFPPGVTPDMLVELIGRIREAGAQSAIDAGPAWLSGILDTCPDLVTPNLAEAQGVLHGLKGPEPVEVGPTALESARQAADELVTRGARSAVVTAGRYGAAWSTGDDGGQCEALAISAVNPIGAGDAFLGGLVARLASGDCMAEAVRWGTATAGSAIQQWIPGAARAADVSELKERVS